MTPKNFIDKQTGESLFPSYNGKPIEVCDWSELYNHTYAMWELNVEISNNNDNLKNRIGEVKKENNQLVAFMVLTVLTLFGLLVFGLINFWQIIDCFGVIK